MDLMDLITTEKIEDKELHSINARSLHKFFEVKGNFVLWFARAKVKAKIRIPEDFFPFEYVAKNGTTAKDYTLTMKSALKLSRLQSNSKGRDATKFFLALETIDYVAGVTASAPIVEEVPEPSKDMALIEVKQSVIGDTEINSVDARKLHEFLGSQRNFATWINERIETYNFMESIDFIVFDKYVKNLKGGRPTTEYTLSMSMAKELCMLEHNAQGKEARKYFIECERIKDELESGALKGLPNFNDPVAAARAWADTMEQKLIAQTQRDEAIAQRTLVRVERDEAVRTKSCISDKKTATAMNTASVLKRENTRLKKTIDSMEYKYLSELDWLTKYFKGVSLYAARAEIEKYLVRLSKEMGLAIITRSKTEKNPPKLYHRDVVNRLRETMDTRCKRDGKTKLKIDWKTQA